MYEDLGEDNLDEIGVEQPTKIALLDADTLAFAAVSIHEYAEEVLPREMYSDGEWSTIINSEGYDEEQGCVWHGDFEAALNKAVQDVEDLISEMGCISAELHFSTGKNFRYDVFSGYKANRKSMHYPPNNREVKYALLEKYQGAIHSKLEADDVVVRLKQDYPDKYILGAVDKDVLNAVEGRHYNYYRSEKYSIPRKWIDIDPEHAFKWSYYQCIMGDSTDGFKGVPGVGKVGAAKAIEGCNTPEALWKAVVKTYKSKGLTEEDALMTMRLVNMMQAHIVDGEFVLKLWEPQDVVS